MISHNCRWSSALGLSGSVLGSRTLDRTADRTGRPSARLPARARRFGRTVRSPRSCPARHTAAGPPGPCARIADKVVRPNRVPSLRPPRALGRYGPMIHATPPTPAPPGASARPEESLGTGPEACSTLCLGWASLRGVRDACPGITVAAATCGGLGEPGWPRGGGHHQREDPAGSRPAGSTTGMMSQPPSQGFIGKQSHQSDQRRPWEGMGTKDVGR
jgi:hypothetical protein